MPRLIARRGIGSLTAKQAITANPTFFLHPRSRKRKAPGGRVMFRYGRPKTTARKLKRTSRLRGSLWR